MSDETRDEYKLVDDKITEKSNLWTRMDKDEDAYFLKSYKMMQLPPNDSKEMPEVANITLNDPLLYATKAIAILSGATMQTVVEGKSLPDKKTTTIESFLEDFYYALDEDLVNKGYLGLDSMVNEQVCIRGRIAARIALRMEGNDLVRDLLPVDTRHFVYEPNVTGMEWGCNITQRSKSRIKKEYGMDISSDFGEVRDFWDSKKNTVFVEKDIAKEQKNPYGYPPFVVSICPIGSSLNSINAQEHEGESIFWQNRDLWQEKNRTASILQTLSITAIFGGLQYESSKGEQATKPNDSPFGVRKVNPVEKGGGYKPMPIADIKNATRLFYAVLDASLQKGSLSVIDYGTLSFPLSAIAITRLTGSRDDIFLPRVQSKARFYQAASRMVINQCLQIGKQIKLGLEGNINTYGKTDLDGDYSIKYRFFTESREQDIADLSIANAAQGYLSADTIRREILKLKDPDGEETKFLSEQAEKVDEVLFLYRRASKLIEDGKNLDAYILAKRIVVILKQRSIQNSLSGIEGKVRPGEENKGEPVVPLLAEGKTGAGKARSGVVPSEPTELNETKGVEHGEEV